MLSSATCKNPTADGKGIPSFGDAFLFFALSDTDGEFLESEPIFEYY
jgi:hypothetical protein